MTAMHGPGKGPPETSSSPAPHSEQTQCETALGHTRGELLSAAAAMQKTLAPYGEDATHTLSLFAKLCLESPAAHTLFGTKPLSEHFIHSHLTQDDTIRSRWASPDELNAWQRVATAAELTSPHFVLQESKSELPHDAGKVLLLYSIHNIREVYAVHGGRFRAKLGEDTTADTVISLVKAASDFNTLFGGDHELKGLLVGYGDMSAQAYARLAELAALGDLGPLSSAEKMRARCESATLDPSFPRSEYLQLVDDIQGNRRVTSTFRNSVHFRSHKADRESEELQTRYDKTSQALVTLCIEEGQDVVAQVALAKWCGLLR